ADFGTWHADLGQTGTDRRLSRDEGGTTGCTALLAVPVSEHRAFFGDTIDVRRAVAHDSVVVGTDIEPADIVAPDDQYIWSPSHAAPSLIENLFFDFKNGKNRTPFALLAMRKKSFLLERSWQVFFCRRFVLGAPTHSDLTAGRT